MLTRCKWTQHQSFITYSKVRTLLFWNYKIWSIRVGLYPHYFPVVEQDALSNWTGWDTRHCSNNFIWWETTAKEKSWQSKHQRSFVKFLRSNQRLISTTVGIQIILHKFSIWFKFVPSAQQNLSGKVLHSILYKSIKEMHDLANQ